MKPYEEDNQQGVFYSTAGMKGANSLVGPAHVLLVDFMVTEKFMAKIIKNLDLPQIDFTEVAKLLQNIQKEILTVKGVLNDTRSEDAKKIRLDSSRKFIEEELNKVKKISNDFEKKLEAASKLPENKDKEALIVGAIKSIKGQMEGLKYDVQKIFKKLQNADLKAGPRISI